MRICVIYFYLSKLLLSKSVANSIPFVDVKLQLNQQCEDINSGVTLVPNDPLSDI
jgi:hypothetical protein